jgi:hypothetical protein
MCIKSGGDEPPANRPLQAMVVFVMRVNIDQENGEENGFTFK